MSTDSIGVAWWRYSMSRFNRISHGSFETVDSLISHSVDSSRWSHIQTHWHRREAVEKEKGETNHKY